MKNKFKLKTLKIIAIGAIGALVFNLASPNFLNNSDTEAIGDLVVNWGVPEGSPIFTVTNAAPGQTEDRNVVVTNSAPSLRPVGVRGVLGSEIDDLKSTLEMTIAVDGVDVYGGTSGTKTLTQFFTESSGPDGIFLVDLNPSQTKTINFKIAFPTSSGNEFQDTSIVFDLIIGLSIDIPDECDQLDLLPTPIIGTSKAENLTGTPGNDLIMGLEGADKIEGNSGDDCILGGTGADRINGNSGNDAIFGESGADTINGNGGNDLIVGGTGADTLRGENGQDHLIGNESADTLEGGNDNDLLEGNEAPDTMRGGNGDDELMGGAGIDTANGNSGTDTCDAETESNCEI